MSGPGGHEPVDYLSLEDVLAAAAASQESDPQVVDFGLLESALARPRATVFGEDAYSGMHAKAAALLSSLVKNHALQDGNKRLGLVAVRLFYGLNGYDFVATDDQKFELILDIAADRLVVVPEIADRLAAYAVLAASDGAS